MGNDCTGCCEGMLLNILVGGDSDVFDGNALVVIERSKDCAKGTPGTMGICCL